MLSDHQVARTKAEGDPDERETPDELFATLHSLWDFTLDACATDENAKLRTYFTKAQDGLKQSWKGHRVWCNPPFSDIATWVRKASAFEADVCVLLVPAWTDRRWWHDLIEPFRDRPHSGVRVNFLPGRPKFYKPASKEVDRSAPFGVAVLTFERGNL